MPKTAKKDRQGGEEAVLQAIASMPDSDRATAETLHKLITKNAPELIPRTWYGMPAYSNGDKLFCFFRSRQKFGERYMVLGFNDPSKLDEDNMWPIYFAVSKIGPEEEKTIAKLVKKAVS